MAAERLVCQALVRAVLLQGLHTSQLCACSVGCRWRHPLLRPAGSAT